MLLSGCAASSGDYPSLAYRDAERMAGSIPAPAASGTPPPVATPTVGQDEIAQLLASARASHEGFVAALEPAARQIAAGRGADRDSTAYALAQIALADLESTRSTAAIALGDLDLLYADTTLAYTAREEVSAAREAVVALISAEDRTLAELRGAMGS